MPDDIQINTWQMKLDYKINLTVDQLGEMITFKQNKR